MPVDVLSVSLERWIHFFVVTWFERDSGAEVGSGCHAWKMFWRREPKDRPPEPWKDKAQVVDVRRSRFEPAMLEVAVLMKDSDGMYVHRRVRCTARDLDTYFLFDPDPGKAAERNVSGGLRWVEDHRYETEAAARRAAEEQSPAAKPSKWAERFAFSLSLSDHDGVTRRFAPEAADLRPLQTVLVLGVFWATFSVVGLAPSVLVLQWVSGEHVADAVFVTMAIMALPAGAASVAADWWLRDLLSRHNLDRAINGSEARSLGQELRGELDRACGRFGITARTREPGRHEAPRPGRSSFFRKGSATE